jgi:hypothetical protein
LRSPAIARPSGQHAPPHDDCVCAEPSLFRSMGPHTVGGGVPCCGKPVTDRRNGFVTTAPWVRAKIRDVIRDQRVAFGFSTAARGADLLFLDELLGPATTPRDASATTGLPFLCDSVKPRRRSAVSDRRLGPQARPGRRRDCGRSRDVPGHGLEGHRHRSHETRGRTVEGLE